MKMNMIMTFYSNMAKELKEFLHGSNNSFTDEQVEQLCKESGMTVNQLLFNAMQDKTNLYFQMEKYKGACELLQEENKRQQSIMEAMTANKNELQQFKVKHGEPIARKANKVLIGLYLRNNYTDAQIMEETGISRTTLWRAKKALEEERLAKEAEREKELSKYGYLNQ